ncbi:hypothetical protein [Agrococcus sp. HG114]|uniref:hypothetical protein n=1 Tax=Agrococcus sp. HG114 TaxID=2969757 RepID=UPI00215B2F4D|nr:hypothetical protein [Agrococcus sp. HG114]MCR8670642.1 hypothetical protein [Agrococcus sp. HG114]
MTDTPMLDERSPVNPMTLLTFVVAMVFILGGLLLMGYAFETPGWEAVLFTAGAVSEFIGVAVPALLWQWENRRRAQQ